MYFISTKKHDSFKQKIYGKKYGNDEEECEQVDFSFSSSSSLSLNCYAGGKQKKQNKIFFCTKDHKDLKGFQ